MARKQNNVPLTEEEIKERALEWSIKKLPFLNDPTVHYNIGDRVVYGGFSEVYVEDVVCDGKIYLLKFKSKKATEYSYIGACWMDIRPYSITENATLSKNRNNRIWFTQRNIESLLHMYYSFGIDMNPEYQRGYVWGAKDKELLIDSIFQNIEIGKFAVVHKNNDINGPLYEILDGKQRLTTLVEFYENRFAYNGFYFKDLNGVDKNNFLNFDISLAEIDRNDIDNQKVILEYFLRLNRAGKTTDTEHLSKIERMLIVEGQESYGFNRVDERP